MSAQPMRDRGHCGKTREDRRGSCPPLRAALSDIVNFINCKANGRVWVRGGATAPFPPKIILVPGLCPLLYSGLAPLAREPVAVEVILKSSSQCCLWCR